MSIIFKSLFVLPLLMSAVAKAKFISMYPSQCGELTERSDADVADQLYAAKLRKEDVQRLLSREQTREFARTYALALAEISKLPREFFDQVKDFLTKPQIAGESNGISKLTYFSKVAESTGEFEPNSSGSIDRYVRIYNYLTQITQFPISGHTRSVLATALTVYPDVSSYYCELSRAGMEKHLLSKFDRLRAAYVKATPFVNGILKDRKFTRSGTAKMEPAEIKTIGIPSLIRSAMLEIQEIDPELLENLIASRTLLDYVKDQLRQRLRERYGDQKQGADSIEWLDTMYEVVFSPIAEVELLGKADIRSDVVDLLIREIRILSFTAFIAEMEANAKTDTEKEDAVDTYTNAAQPVPTAFEVLPTLKQSKIKTKGTPRLESLEVSVESPEKLEDVTKWNDGKINNLFKSMCVNSKSFAKFFKDLRNPDAKNQILQAIYLLSIQKSLGEIPYVRSEREGVYAIAPPGTAIRVFFGLGRGKGIKILLGDDNVKASREQQRRLINEALDAWK